MASLAVKLGFSKLTRTVVRGQDVIRLLDRRVVDFSHLTDSVLKGSAKLCKTRQWQQKYAAYLISAMTNGQWTQMRLAMTRTTTDDKRCQLCRAQVQVQSTTPGTVRRSLGQTLHVGG